MNKLVKSLVYPIVVGGIALSVAFSLGNLYGRATEIKRGEKEKVSHLRSLVEVGNDFYLGELAKSPEKFEGEYLLEAKCSESIDSTNYLINVKRIISPKDYSDFPHMLAYFSFADWRILCAPGVKGMFEEGIVVEEELRITTVPENVSMQNDLVSISLRKK